MVEFTQEKVSVQNLVLGMYVARLDRPWIGTPFPIQGFHIKSFDEIRTLGSYCRYVYVDMVKSKIEVDPSAKSRPARSGRKGKEARAYVNLKVNESSYTRTRGIKQEISTASNLQRDMAAAVESVMKQIASGKPANIPATRKVANRMIDSILLNPDASIWIARVRDKDTYTYGHSVRSSVWAITFGRHLGLRKERLENLAMGVLLSEVGYTRLPTEILTRKERLTMEEHETMKKHVDYSVEILKNIQGINEDILWTVRTHHERYNGTGFPRGLRGNQIPLLGKIAGIVDFYDSVTAPRYDEEALSPADAMARLHEMRDEEFQAELVDEFIQAIGIYPTGSLIELSTGEVGIITEQNLDRRLRPKVILILDRDKQPVKKTTEVDLLSYTQDRDGQPVDIQKGLPDGAYGIDLTQFRLNVLSRLLGLGHTLFRH
ncbi:MAG: HD-GYP domain-containing protein [Gammaproteobacteria bacterium]|nr:HD-GYP domain-containing protein [Gammaproteobacteria bacterium]